MNTTVIDQFGLNNSDETKFIDVICMAWHFLYAQTYVQSENTQRRKRVEYYCYIGGMHFRLRFRYELGKFLRRMKLIFMKNGCRLNEYGCYSRLAPATMSNAIPIYSSSHSLYIVPWSINAIAMSLFLSLHAHPLSHKSRYPLRNDHILFKLCAFILLFSTYFTWA